MSLFHYVLKRLLYSCPLEVLWRSYSVSGYKQGFCRAVIYFQSLLLDTENLSVAVTAQHWSNCEEIPHMGYPHGVPCPRAKEKSQQDGRRGKIVFRIKPHSCQRCSEGSNKSCVHKDPETSQRLSRTVFECLLRRYGSPVDCHRDRGYGCSRLEYDISHLGEGCH